MALISCIISSSWLFAVGCCLQAAEAIYIDVARSCTENNLLKFSAKGYLLQAGICALCYASDDDMAIKLDQYRCGKGMQHTVASALQRHLLDVPAPLASMTVTSKWANI